MYRLKSKFPAACVETDLDLDADQILLRLTSPTSQFVDHAKEMALGSGDESCTRGDLSISTLDKQPDVRQ